MVILRPTRKLAFQLPANSKPSVQSDTALGDWYVKKVVVNRQPLLLLVSSKALLPMVALARDVRGLPSRLADLVAVRLARLRVPGPTIEAEIRAMTPVVISPTIDRSVLGILVDLAKVVPYHLEGVQIGAGCLRVLEDHLAETPCHASLTHERVVFPDAKALELLRAKWGWQTSA
jgi:hypothetical protein